MCTHFSAPSLFNYSAMPIRSAFRVKEKEVGHSGCTPYDQGSWMLRHYTLIFLLWEKSEPRRSFLASSSATLERGSEDKMKLFFSFCNVSIILDFFGSNRVLELLCWTTGLPHSTPTHGRCQNLCSVGMTAENSYSTILLMSLFGESVRKL